MKIARIYLRVSAPDQSIERQRAVVDQARAAGYYIAAVYEEQASGMDAARPQLRRMIGELQPGDVLTSSPG